MGGILTDGMRELRSYSSGEVCRRKEKLQFRGSVQEGREGIDRRKHDRDLESHNYGCTFHSG